MDEIVNLGEIASQICFEGLVVSVVPYGNGHINDTFCLTTRLENGLNRRYILQKMNKSIFTKPEELMENIMGVTSWIRKKVIEAGGNPDRETLNVILTKDGKSYYLDSKGDYWRSYLFIEDATCYEKVDHPEDFYNSAVSFGNFQRLLADYPAETLHETIVNFHNTIDRMEKFKAAVREDMYGKAGEVKREIRFVLEREMDTHIICDALSDKQIPLRVTHNDTKLNNIMMDNKTGKGICVIDLDTVMPGSTLYDYGDSIRFGASSAAEDEADLSKVYCDMDLFKAYTKGFIEGCGGSLTRQEILLMPIGAKLMTLECGIRFLTDYLRGDVYFKIHREGQNLARARTQLKLVSDMEEKWDEMMETVKEYL